MDKTNIPLSYKDAGVDIDSGDALVDSIRPLAKSTNRDGCVSDVGGFGALFRIPEHYKRPILVSGTDGVGTKIMLALEAKRHSTIGIDLVGMCANDVLAQGAEPLFFLDYFACGKLDSHQALEVVEGIAEGCRQAGAALIGGETAEMPGMYSVGKYDLAGFCVGVVEQDKILDGKSTQVGDAIIGIGSSGLHSNGYSLVRHIIKENSVDLDGLVDGELLLDLLLKPTRIYVKPVLSLLDLATVRGIAHITGGGLPGNLERILPDNCSALIEPNWHRPSIFNWLQEAGAITDQEMYRTFNCGIGLTIVLPADDAAGAITHMHQAGEDAWIIGHVKSRTDGPRVSLL